MSDTEFDLEELLDTSPCLTIEQIEDRRVELLHALQDLIDDKNEAQEKLSVAIGDYKSGRGKTPVDVRRRLHERFNRCKLDMQAVNTALAELKALQRALPKDRGGVPTGKYKIRRTAMHFVALAEEELDPAVFESLLKRAKLRAGNGVPVISEALAEIGDLEESP